MFRISESQRIVLRLGSIIMFAGAIVAAVIALTVETSSPTSTDVTVVEDPTSYVLPRAGLFGGKVMVYGATEKPGVSQHDLGCHLLRDGEEVSSAKMSELWVLASPPPPVTVDGTRLLPLFEIDDAGAAELSCDTASSVEPLAVSAPSTFGSFSLVVKVAAAVMSVAFLLMGVFALIVFKPRHGRGL